MGNLTALGNTVVQTTPVGVIEAFAGVNAPAGWLFCDGSAVSRIQYPELFSALGTTYGSGDGSTTFNLPDLRGRVPAGKDNMGGSAANRLTSANSGITATSLGANGGDERLHQHTHTQNAHTHTQNSHSHTFDRGEWTTAGAFGGQVGVWGATKYTTQNTSGVTASNQNTTATNQNTGSGNSQNVQPTLIVNYIIKAYADLPRGGWFYQNQPPVVTQLPSNPQIGEQVYLYTQYGYVYERYNGTSWDIISDNRKIYSSVTLSTGFVNSATLLNFNNILTNVGSAYSTATGRFTCPLTGKYRATFYGMTENGAGYGLVDLYKNGSLVSLTRGYAYGVSAGHHHFTSDVIVSANATEYFQWRYEGTIRLYSDGLGYTGATFEFIGE